MSQKREEQMSFKTILVHLNDQRRAETVLEPVIELARRHQAHVIGLHVYAALPAAPVSIPYASRVIAGVAGSERKAAEEIEAIFKRMTAGQPFGSEWRCLKVPHVDLASVVMEYGRSADLIVAGQTDPDWDLSPLMDFPERLALESGRPVLVIPRTGRWREMGSNVMIAWKPRRESARAVFDALPVLKAAEAVKILEVEEDATASTAVTTDHTLAIALLRHGIKATMVRNAAERGTGETICARAREDGADLLVLGAYGHSRFREVLFGGVTRYIARHMPVPTLLSH